MTSVAIGVSLRQMQSNSFDSNHKPVNSCEDMRKFVLKLLEELESFVNEDNSDHKYCNELIGQLCHCLKREGSHLDEDSPFRQQMDVYFNLLRNVLRNPKLNPISRTMILEVIELRAGNWSSNHDIDAYYRRKRSELEANESYDWNRGLKTCQSSGALMCPSMATDVLKPSGKFNKPTKVSGKAFLKDEVVIRNGDSGKVTPGAKERLVQITGQTEENIEYAKGLIESTIKRNASPVPFECPNKGFESNLKENMNCNENTENELFESNSIDKSERIGVEREPKMLYSFSVEVGSEVIQLSSNNYMIGLKAKQILQQMLKKESIETNEKCDSNESTSDDNCNELESIVKTDPKSGSIEHDMQSIGWRLQRQLSSTKMEAIDPKLNQIQRSSSQGTVPIGRTSLRFITPEVKPKSEPNVKITYGRQFLLSCAESPLSQMRPKSDIMSNILSKTPDIVRAVPQVSQQTFPSLLLKSQSFAQNRIEGRVENW